MAIEKISPNDELYQQALDLRYELFFKIDLLRKVAFNIVFMLLPRRDITPCSAENDERKRVVFPMQQLGTPSMGMNSWSGSLLLENHRQNSLLIV